MRSFERHAVVMALAFLVCGAPSRCIAEETQAPVIVPLEGTTLSGSVDTSGVWNPGVSAQSIPEPSGVGLVGLGAMVLVLASRTCGRRGRARSASPGA